MSTIEPLESINELDSTRESQIMAAVPVYKNTMQQITQLYCCREKETIQKCIFDVYYTYYYSCNQYFGW